LIASAIFSFDLSKLFWTICSISSAVKTSGWFGFVELVFELLLELGLGFESAKGSEDVDVVALFVGLRSSFYYFLLR
jgi:hypothetical protein